MEVNVNSTVITYNVKSVRINSILINKAGDNLSITVPYQWIDASGRVINTGTNVYTPQEMLQALPDQATNLTKLTTIFNSLFPNGSFPSIMLNLKDGISAIAGSFQVINKKQQWISSQISQDQLVQMLASNNANISMITDLINGFISLGLQITGAN
jgi:hypothetical protein